MNPTQRRLFISSGIMFLFFGLVPSLPPLHFNKDLFPGTRHMYSLHIQSTCNGMMLMILGLLHPHLNLSSLISMVFEISINLGAWFNVFPWLYGGITGAVFKMGDGQVGGNHLANPFKHNAQLSANIETMLIICTLGDIIAWIIVLISLLTKVKIDNIEGDKKKQ